MCGGWEPLTVSGGWEPLTVSGCGEYLTEGRSGESPTGGKGRSTEAFWLVTAHTTFFRCSCTGRSFHSSSAPPSSSSRLEHSTHSGASMMSVLAVPASTSHGCPVRRYFRQVLPLRGGPIVVHLVIFRVTVAWF